MKVVSHTSQKHAGNFYSSTVAPVHARELRFGLTDIILLTVLFLEVAALMRLFLAK